MGPDLNTFEKLALEIVISIKQVLSMLDEIINALGSQVCREGCEDISIQLL